MMSGLYLALLGPISAAVDGGPSLTFQTQRTQALLFFLATESALGTDVQRRDALMELLWPGLPPKSARVNLRQTLYLLRQAVADLGDIPFLLTDRHTAQINPDYPLQSDVAEFVAHLEGPQDAWPEAVALYRGDFLADFYLADANEFEAWAASRRAAFRRQVLQALDTLTAERMAEGAFEEAQHFGRRQLEIDNLRERAYRQLMQIYAWTGRQSEALRLYQQCVEILEAELATVPDEATIELHQAIREDRLGPPSVSPAAVSIPGERVEPVVPDNPFRGLFSFREEDANYFFGRESFTRRLLEEVERRPLLALIGPSGSGKSSVLFAGLAARVRQDRSWAIVAFRPGSDPFQALAAPLLPLLEPELSETDRLLETRRLASALREGGLPLGDVLSRIVSKDAHYERFLLLVDQFEELYTLFPSRQTRERFLDLLLAARGIRDDGPLPRSSVVLALRADFMGQALGYRPLADALQDADLKLGPMTRQELARAVVKPAQLHGVDFVPGLVDRILDDVGREPGTLPLLQFALATLWEEQEEGCLTHGAYEAIGRVQGALAHYAEEVYGQLSPAQKDRARTLFLQTIRPGLQTEDTRRLALRGELSDEEWAVAQQLADARLVVISRDPAGRQTLELVHEALIHGWDRLRAWLEKDRAFRAWQERLRAALRQWQASGQDEGALLRGVPLSEAQGWLRERPQRLSPEEKGFIEASLQQRDARRARRRREREARERTRRRITQGITGAFVVTLILALFAAVQWRQAVQARDRAETATALQLAAVARTIAQDELDVASLLSVEAYRRSDTFEIRNSLLTTLTQSPHLTAFLHGHEADVRAVAFSPDGRTLATGGADGPIRLWDAVASRALGPPLTGHSNMVRSLAFSPDGRTFASSSLDDTIRIWRTEDAPEAGGTSPATSEADAAPASEAILTLKADNVAGLAYSPDGRVLASAEGEHLIQRQADANSSSFGQALGAPIAGTGAKLVSVAFSPEGDLLAAGDAQGAILIWDVAAHEPLRTLPEAHEGTIADLAFSPSGKLLASASSDGTAVLWDVETWRTAAPPLQGHADWVTGVAFATGGRSLLSSGRDGQILLWDLSGIADGNFSEPQPPSTTVQGHGRPVWGVATNSQGNMVASTGARPGAALWDLSRTHSLARPLNGHRNGLPVTGASFSPDGKTLASASRDSTILLWDVEQGSPTFGQPLYELLDANSAWVIFSPDGKLLASGGSDDRIRLWDVTGYAQIKQELAGHEQSVRSAAFSPDGRLLASGGNDSKVILWDVDEHSASFGQQLFNAGYLDHLCCQLIFSGDGKMLLLGANAPRLLRWDVPALLENGNLQGQTLPPVTGFAGGVHALDLSPDGRTLVSASADATIRLWSVESGQQLGKPLESQVQVYETFEMAFSPDGRTLASTASRTARNYSNSEIYLWDVPSRQSYDRVLTGHRNGVYDIAFSPDGSVLASTGFVPSQIMLWDVDPESWARRACRLANRNLTLEEWQRYFGQEPYRPTCPALPVLDTDEAED